MPIVADSGQRAGGTVVSGLDVVDVRNLDDVSALWGLDDVAPADVDTKAAFVGELWLRSEF